MTRRKVEAMFGPIAEGLRDGDSSDKAEIMSCLCKLLGSCIAGIKISEQENVFIASCNIVKDNWERMNHIVAQAISQQRRVH